VTVTVHPSLSAAADAARLALAEARRRHEPAELSEVIGTGADGTPTMRIDSLVEERVVDALSGYGVNILSEEAGLLDRGSALTVVLDPLDGSANAAAGVPLSCVSAVLAVDDTFTEALTCWLDTGHIWTATTAGGCVGPGKRRLSRTSGQASVAGSALSMLRPHTGSPAGAAWWALAKQAARIRVLSCSTLEIALVADGATDAFADPGSAPTGSSTWPPARCSPPVAWERSVTCTTARSRSTTISPAAGAASTPRPTNSPTKSLTSPAARSARANPSHKPQPPTPTPVDRQRGSPCCAKK
jgi:myo-inositol-1(or 4)-monophosphatase